MEAADMFQRSIDADTVDFGTVGESCDFTVLAGAFHEDLGSDPFLGMDFNLGNSETVVLESDPLEADLLAIAASIVVETGHEVAIGMEVVESTMAETELTTEEEVMVADMLEPESVSTPPSAGTSSEREEPTPPPPPSTLGNAPRSSSEVTRIELMSSAECEALGLEFPLHRLPLSFFNERTMRRFPLNLAHKYKMQQRAGDTWLPDINFDQPNNTTREPAPRKRKPETAPSSTITSSATSARNGDKLPEIVAAANNPPPAAPEPRRPDPAMVPPPMSTSAARRALCAFHCPRCKNVYKHRGTLKRHLISKHNILEDVPELDP